MNRRDLFKIIGGAALASAATRREGVARGLLHENDVNRAWREHVESLPKSTDYRPVYDEWSPQFREWNRLRADELARMTAEYERIMSLPVSASERQRLVMEWFARS